MLSDNIHQQVSQACLRSLCLEIYYAKASGEKSRYELIPVSYRTKDNVTMLYGFDLAENKTKAFRLDRIISAATIEKRPWPEKIQEKIGFPLELVTSEKPVPKLPELLLKPTKPENQ